MEWKVSTSQQPQNQTGLMNMDKYPDKISPGGGFGPVADSGYGISYMIANDKEVPTECILRGGFVLNRVS